MPLAPHRLRRYPFPTVVAPLLSRLPLLGAALALLLTTVSVASLAEGQHTGGVGAAPGRAVPQKVLPPIEVILEPLNDAGPGEVARFRVVVTPRVVPREVRVVCRAAPEIAWVAGDTLSVSSGALNRGDELEVAVRVPRSGFHPLHFAITLTAEDGTVWRRGVGTRLGPDDPSKRARSVQMDAGGRATIEYPAAPATRMAGEGR